MALKLRADFGACPVAPHNTDLLHVAKNLRCSFQISTLALIAYAELSVLLRSVFPKKFRLKDGAVSATSCHSFRLLSSPHLSLC